MKGMKSADEFQQAPLPGVYWSLIATAEAQFTKKEGATMIKLSLSIDDARFSQYKDVACDDYMVTDGGAKGGGMGKTKLRGLGIDVDSSDQELSDEAICSQLVGKGVWVTYGNEQRMGRSVEGGPYDVPMTAIDAKTGQVIKLFKLNVKGYSQHNVGQAQAAAPAQHAPAAAPYAQQPQQGAPQGWAPSQQGFAPPVQQGFAPPPQYAQQPQQGFAPAPGFAPPQPQQQGGPVQYAQQPQTQQPQFTQAPQGMQQAAPPWTGQQQQQHHQQQQQQAAVPNGAPPAAPGKPKRVRGQIDDKSTPEGGPQQ